MKRNTKGLTSIEVIIIIAIVIIIGVIVYLSSRTDAGNTMPIQTITNNTPTNVDTNSAPITTDNDNEQPAVTEPVVSSPVKQDLSGDALMVSYVKQLRAEADSKFNGKFSSTFVAGNNAQTIGSGIVTSTVGKKVVEDVKAANGNIFVITNGTGPTSYAIYASLSKSGTYYCNASDGSTKDSTTKVVDNITGLGANPICK